MVAPCLFDNHVVGKLMANEISIGGVMLDACLCILEDAFVMA